MSEWDPELYNRFRDYRAEPVTMILTRLNVGARERIVDLGCGTGEHTVELARRSPEGRLLGIDSSPAMIQRAQALRESLGPELRRRVEFQLKDFRNFNAEQAYTLIFSNAALQWVGNHAAVLATCYRALDAGGRLAIQMPANEAESAQATMREMALEPTWNMHLAGTRSPSDENVLTPAEYHRILSQIGFVGLDCFYHVFHHPMKSPAEVVEFCRSTSLRRFLDPLPSDRRNEFVADLTRRLERSYGTCGPMTFNFRRLFLQAQRP